MTNGLRATVLVIAAAATAVGIWLGEWVWSAAS